MIRAWFIINNNSVILWGIEQLVCLISLPISNNIFFYILIFRIVIILIINQIVSQLFFWQLVLLTPLISLLSHFIKNRQVLNWVVAEVQLLKLILVFFSLLPLSVQSNGYAELPLKELVLYLSFRSWEKIVVESGNPRPEDIEIPLSPALSFPLLIC